MFTIKLVFPVFSFLWGALFFYFPNTQWSNLFVLLHRNDNKYLSASNQFIGKTMMIFSLLFFPLSLLSLISIKGIFIPWLFLNGLLIPVYFDVYWRRNNL